MSLTWTVRMNIQKMFDLVSFLQHVVFSMNLEVLYGCHANWLL